MSCHHHNRHAQRLVQGLKIKHPAYYTILQAYAFFLPMLGRRETVWWTSIVLEWFVRSLFRSSVVGGDSLSVWTIGWTSLALCNSKATVPKMRNVYVILDLQSLIFAIRTIYLDLDRTIRSQRLRISLIIPLCTTDSRQLLHALCSCTSNPTTTGVLTNKLCQKWKSDIRKAIQAHFS